MPGPSDDDVRVRAILEDQLSEPAERVRRALEELDRQNRETANSTNNLSNSQEQQAQASRDQAKAAREATQRQREMEQAVRRMNREYEQEQRAAERAARAQERHRRAVRRNALQMGKFLKFQKLLNGWKFDLIAQLATGIAALGAAGYAAVAGLSPLVGTLTPIPALLGGVVMWGATAKLAFTGIGDAVSALNAGDMEKFAEATKSLGPNAKDAAWAFAEIYKNFKPIKQMVQEKALQGFADDVQLLGEKYLPMLSNHMYQAADGFNTTLSYATGFMALPQTVEGMNRVLANSVVISELFGHTLNGVLRGTIHLMDAAGPTAVKMARGMSDSINHLADKIYQNQERINAFADRGLMLWRRVWKVIKDIGVALYNTGRMSMSLAGSMGVSFEQMIARWRAWTESAEGQAKIKKFFDDMRPNIEAIGRLIVALSKGFNDISRSQAFAGIMDQISAFIPVLVRIIHLADGEYIPALVSIIDSIARVVAGMNLFGPLGVVLQGVAWALKGIADGFAALPDWVQSAMGVLVSFGLWFLMLRRLWPLIQMIFGTAWVAALRAALMSLLSWIWSALIVPLMTFLFTNPIGWIILAVIALVAAFVLLWKKCEGFRNLVKAIGQWFVDVWNNTLYPWIMKIWEWMKDAWDKAYAVVSDIVGGIINWFVTNWDTIKAVVTSVVNFIIGWFKFWWSIAGPIVGFVVMAFKQGFQNILAVTKFVINWIVGGWKLIWPVVQAVLNLIVAWFKLAWNTIRLVVNVVIAVILLAIRNIITVVKFVVNWIVNGWKWAWNIVSTVVRVAVAIVSAIIGWLSPKVEAVVETTTGYFRTGWNVVKTVVGTVVDWVGSKIEGIIKFVSNVIDAVTAIFEVGWNLASDYVGGAIDKVRGYIDPVVGWISNVLSRIRTVWDSVWGGMRDFVMGIIDNIKNGIDAITNVVNKISNGIGAVADKLPGLATGGPVRSGMTALVGEKGPEAFLSKTGKMSMIGTHGPEIRNFKNPGYVVPNHVLRGQHDSSVPYNVMGRLEKAMQDRKEGQYAGVQTKPRPGAGGAQREYMNSSPNVVVKIGKVEQGVDITNAVKQGILEWERNRKERG